MMHKCYRLHNLLHWIMKLESRLSFQFQVMYAAYLVVHKNTQTSQCDYSYGFSVIVRVTVTGFIIFQLQLQLK